MHLDLRDSAMVWRFYLHCCPYNIHGLAAKAIQKLIARFFDNQLKLAIGEGSGWKRSVLVA
ncbi:hypothetical protein [Sphingobium sp. Ant17]|jgi:hypothetical protein|uniref:hypothetical protein n=1 Tax=Sphingobium sp. Ant17 TaxID=1461752 RepID=UPI0012685607|nr:hypothetical protein [Sphingobium sp. Ant17]|tara:strand:- start:10853 stop:11035 length:183 start_codon:yes stop_codon:yes gene_type:complete